ncbi:MAG TPA: T9SS type A sorting domain-containing protein, partial [Candidatus Marinimicrobia bacterium]|nr:T9SS type A sorting domain-containing protein [Candidatus Neomarinimicrobiota bacterium]
LMLAYNGTTMYNNSNGSSKIVYDDTRHRIYTVMGMNSVAAVDLNSLVRVATPRDAGWLAVNLDGYGNEYTHYDLIDESNEREMYVTWGEEIMYFAFNGNTLYNPFQEKGLYIAFDLDPDGENGSTAPPTSASGISAYPFAADVVFQLWSDDAVDLSSNDPADKWTVGNVYKWSGSAWIESSIDGLDINYGAMAIIGDGYDGQMTEIGIARTPSGIGSDFSDLKVLAYLADEAEGGQVHMVWPPANATGAAPAFSAAYVSAGLDTMVLPMRHLIAENATSISNKKLVPASFELGQAYPNPFNPMTTIPYTLRESAQVALQVYSLRGELVEDFAIGFQSAGSYTFQFDGANLPSGLYIYRLKINNQFAGTQKMALIK